MAEYPIHPAAELFPLLEGVELQQLADDIRTQGLSHPIVVHEGRILDGRNRFRACELAGVEPIFREWVPTGDPMDWVVSTNLHRRHLTTSQRALLAVELVKNYEERARARMLSGVASAPDAVAATTSNAEGPVPLPEAEVDDAVRVPDAPAALPPSTGSPPASDADTRGRSTAKAAQKVHVSRTSVTRAEKLVASAAPELIEAVRAGTVTVSAASEVAKLTPDEQREIVQRREVTERARVLRGGVPAAEAVGSDGDLGHALVLSAFKAAYRKGPRASKRQPIDEVERLDHIFTTAVLVERAWKWITAEWTTDKRTNMGFAVDAGLRMTPLIVEFRERLAEILARCRGEVSEEDGSTDAPPG